MLRPYKYTSSWQVQWQAVGKRGNILPVDLADVLANILALGMSS